MEDSRPARRLWLTALKTVLWTVMAVVLLGAGLLVCTVKLLTPERLTALSSRIANRVLNADVAIGRASLTMRGSYPFLNLDVDSLTIVARDIRNLPAAVRDSLPCWGDTLADIHHIHGGINVVSLLGGRIALSDVVITHPTVNILVVNDSLNNFTIVPPSAAPADTAAVSVPDITINRFLIADPGPIRFADIAGDLHATALLSEAYIQGSPSDVPLYHVAFASDISSPLLTDLGLSAQPIGLNGNLRWSHTRPLAIELSDFDYIVSILSGRIDTSVDFTDRMTVESFSLTLDPVNVARTLDMIPDATKRRFSIPEGIATDATVAVAIRLTEPYVMGTTLLPRAVVDISIPESSLRWRQVDLRRMALDASVDLRGDSFDDAVVTVSRLLVAGPATTVDVAGTVTDIATDPLFDGTVNGDIRLERIPRQLADLVPGVFRGRIRAHTDIKGRPSMFSRNAFHKLRVSGDVNLDNFFYLADDTALMFDAHHALFTFGSNERITGRRCTVDSLLTARIAIDSAAILKSDISMKLRDVTLSVGALNNGAIADTTAIIPMGGRLAVGAFSVLTLTDSAGMRLRDLSGSVSMHRYKGDSHHPVFRGNLDIRRISAGSAGTRLLLTDSHIGLRASLTTDERSVRRRKQVKAIADSIRRLNPGLSLDSVYVLALERHRRRSRPGHHRVHTAIDSTDNEILDWGTSRGFSAFLRDWDLRGSIRAGRARLFSAAFPVRNRIEGLDIRFSTDSVNLSNVRYKAGHSDFLISGNISNIRRALTSRRPQPIKVNFDLVSDTVDVNELAAAFFKGAANTAEGTTAFRNAADLSEEEMDRVIADRDHRSDSVGPLLIPVNIDAQLNIKARNVLYSDLLLHRLKGTILAFDGAVNLHNLSASSDVGSIDLSALYAAPNTRDMRFGFGLKLSDFNIRHFLRLVPAIDSIMPIMRDFGGIISANIAATSDVDPRMNLVLPSLKAAINLEGDSLVVIDPHTFKTVAKWLLFKNKNENLIRHMSVEMIVEDNELKLFPFMFDFDRYRIGVQGQNDLAMNFDYHIAVLRSPLPFRFGINIKGNPDKFKVRLGRSHFNEKTTADHIALVDTTRINLMQQFESIFRRGVRNSRFAELRIDSRPIAADIDLATDTLSAADSLYLRKEGLIPDIPVDTIPR